MDHFTMLKRLDDGRTWYGPREVAVDVGRACGVSMINNALFRAQNVRERRRLVGLIDRVWDIEGGEVRVFSSLHESGKRLEGLGDVAAILTYLIEDLDEEETSGEKRMVRARCSSDQHGMAWLFILDDILYVFADLWSAIHNLIAMVLHLMVDIQETLKSYWQEEFHWYYIILALS